jgi:uncharacterized membrane protein HdeD (DUF308 family)
MAKIVKKEGKGQTFFWTKKNLYLMGIGLAVLIIGYIFMAQPPVNSIWSLTIAPIILIIAYLIIIPLAIFYRKNKKVSSGE